MPHIKVSGLDQGRKYFVRARVQNSSLNLSDWSLPLAFTTAKDIIAPGPIEDLLFESEGDSFIARWNPPTANEDGSPVTDLAHFRVRVTSLKDAQTRSFTTKDQIVTIDLNRNKNLFGYLAGNLKISVAAVDLSGNVGEYVDAQAQNSPPGRVENVTAEGSVQTIHVGWDKVDENDMDHYLVYVSDIGPGFQPGPDTYLTKTTALEYIMVTKSPDVQYFRVVAVDKFGQESEPSLAAWDYARQSFGTDVEPPSDIKNFNVSLELSTDQSSAEAHVSFDPVLSSDVDKYEVAYKTTSATVWSYITLPSDEVTATISGLKIGTDYQFKARVIDYYANASNWTTVISKSGVIKTTAPPKTLGVDALGGRNNMIIRWDASTDESMANGEGQYEVEYSLSPSFSGSTTVKASGTVVSILNLGEKKTYHVRVRAIDSFGNIGAWSDTDTADTGEVVHDDSVTGVKIAGESITGDHIQTNTIDAASLKAGTAFVGALDVKSTLTVGTNGVIKSENYGPDTAGYYLDKQQLIINDGSISAAALNIQDSHNMIHAAYSAFMFGGAFYLNEENIQRESGATIEPLAGQGRAGSGALKHSGGGTLHLKPVSEYSGGNPLVLEAGEKYIVSAYVKKGSAINVSASIGMFYEELDGSEHFDNQGEPILVSNQNEWTRIETVIDTGFVKDSVAVVRLHHRGPSGGSILWSHLQVERMIGKKESASPWTPPGFTRISGESITTGSIQSSSVGNYGGIMQPAWSLNTKGDLTIGSGYVRGHLIVGGKEDGNGSPEVAIQSKDYTEMLRGWAIKSDGDVEFNDGTFRGVLNLSSPGAGESAPTLTASVRPTDLYVTPTEQKTIHIAGIRGQVTGYTREEIDENSGQYLPTHPDPSKRARYFIGPTTDRSLTIQVHDSSDADDVAFLDAPPDDVNLSLVNIGEITNPAEEPSGYLNQGFRHRSGAGNPDDYAQVEQSSTARTGSSEDIRSSHVFSIDSRSSHHKRSSQTSLALSSNPAETNSSSMNLSVTEFYESGGAINSDSAEYVWTPKGISYPGVETPFMPTAASIVWDWSSYAPGDRPSIGDAATLRTINTGNWGRINTGEGRTYYDRFAGPREKPLRGAWISVGSPHAYKDGNGRVKWAAGDYMGRTGPTNDFYLHSSPLGSFNHEVSAQVNRWGVIFGIGWAAEAVLVCSYDPVTKDGIFFRYKDQAGMNPAAGIYVRRNGVVRAIWESNTRPAYDRYEHKLIRDGNTVRAFLNGNQVATITDNNLPTGEYFGFALEAGQMSEIRGKALVPGSDAKGILLPTSVNVNNRRGITVDQSGAINIDAPGYYMISATLNSDQFGGHWNREYWMTIRHGGVRYEIGNNGSRYDGAGFRHMQGSLLAHMSGPIDFAIHANSAEVSRISKARLEIARLA